MVAPTALGNSRMSKQETSARTSSPYPTLRESKSCVRKSFGEKHCNENRSVFSNYRKLKKTKNPLGGERAFHLNQELMQS